MKMYVCYDNRLGESTVFLKGEKVIGVVDGNDGNWRHEYFNPILKEMGINVEVRKKPLTEKQLEVVVNYFGCDVEL